MDEATIRMLEDLPPGLKRMGWQLVHRESGASSTRDATWYIAVYVRRFEHGVDDDRFAVVANDGFIRVSTNQAQSPSWADAYGDAVQMMEEIDRRRKPGS